MIRDAQEMTGKQWVKYIVFYYSMNQLNIESIYSVYSVYILLRVQDRTDRTLQGFLVVVKNL